MILLLSALSFVGLSFAGDDVLWYTGHGGSVPSSTTTTIRATYLAYGAPAFDEIDVWPGDLSAYRVVFLSLPTLSFDASEVTNIQDFLNAGGILVPIAENSTYFMEVNLVLNELLADLGLSSTFSPTILDAGCGHVGRVVGSDPLMDGFTSFEYGATTDIAVGVGGAALMEGESAQTVLALEAGVVLATDINIFVDNCTLGAAHVQFFENLYDGSCEVTDRDGDGFDAEACGGDDCDDGDADVNPTTLWYEDADGDSYGDPAVSEASCEPPDEDWVAEGNDCDDADATVTLGPRWYTDADGDTHGADGLYIFSCGPVEGYAEDNTDCDDDSAVTWLGADEICDEADNDCDAEIDEDAVDAPTWYPDVDEDGYGVNAGGRTQCEEREGASVVGGDCDDGDPRISPEGEEICDVVDNDCDGEIDEGVTETWYLDADGDGHGDPASPVSDCHLPDGATSDSSDCDDANADVYPEAPGLDAECVALSEKAEDAGGCGCGGATGAFPGALLAVAGIVGRRRRAG